jgi:PadR family transcriptional regulator PadR
MPAISAKVKGRQADRGGGYPLPLLTRQKNAGLLSYRWEESQQGPATEIL